MKPIITSLLVFSFLLWGCGSTPPPKTVTPSIESPDKPIANSSNDSSKVYSQQSFKTLSKFRILKNKFASNYQSEDDSIINNQVPKEIKDLNDTDIEISGYIFPIMLDKGRAASFVLMSVVPNCCFGDNLKLNEVIYVDAAKDLKEISPNRFVKVKGKFNVGMKEVATWQDKFLYTIIADKVELND